MSRLASGHDRGLGVAVLIGIYPNGIQVCRSYKRTRFTYTLDHDRPHNGGRAFVAV